MKTNQEKIIEILNRSVEEAKTTKNTNQKYLTIAEKFKGDIYDFEESEDSLIYDSLVAKYESATLESFNRCSVIAIDLLRQNLSKENTVVCRVNECEYIFVNKEQKEIANGEEIIFIEFSFDKETYVVKEVELFASFSNKKVFAPNIVPKEI